MLKFKFELPELKSETVVSATLYVRIETDPEQLLTINIPKRALTLGAKSTAQDPRFVAPAGTQITGSLYWNKENDVKIDPPLTFNTHLNVGRHEGSLVVIVENE